MPTWPILDALGEQDRRSLLAAARRRRFARGEAVFHRGDPADTMHLVSAGCFAVRVVTRFGDTVTLGLVGPGEWFGELALLRGEPVRSASVYALQAGETLAVSRAEFDSTRRVHREMDSFLIDALAERVAALSDRLVDVLHTPAPRRVIAILDELAVRYGDGSGAATIPLTQDDLAGLAGTSRITVSRVLQDLRASGRVQVRRGRIMISPSAEA